MSFYMAKINENFEIGDSKVKLQKLIAKEVISLKTNKRHTINQPEPFKGFTIQYDTMVANGTKLIYENNSIKIGPGISKILVSGGASILNSPDWNDGGLAIINNAINAITQFQSKSGIETTIDISNILIEVKENDVITLGFQSNETGDYIILSSYLTIEVIE